MPTQKRIDGDYVITTINPPDDVIVNTNTMVINGNLDVVGNLTYIETTELKVDDPFITVAANNTGTLGTATFQEQGLVTQTSANTFAGLRFNNSTQTWQISPSVDANGAPLSAYVTLDTGGTGTPGAPSTSIQFNASGVFAGNAALTFDVANAAVVLQGHQVFGNIGTNKGLKRFSLRGKTKVQGQWQLFCMVHNLEKVSRYGKVGQNSVRSGLNSDNSAPTEAN